MRARAGSLALEGGSAAMGAAALMLLATPGIAFDQSASPCTLASKGAIARAVGLPHVAETTVIGSSYPVETDGRVASNCSIFAWSGRKPKSYKQIQQKLANGTYASGYIRTWITDQGPDADEWHSSGFDTTPGDVEGGCYAVMEAIHGHVFGPPHFGAQQSIGYQGITGSARNVCGVWDRTELSRIIVILLNSSKHSPVVRHLEMITKTAAPAFF